MSFYSIIRDNVRMGFYRWPRNPLLSCIASDRWAEFVWRDLRNVVASTWTMNCMWSHKGNAFGRRCKRFRLQQRKCWAFLEITMLLFSSAAVELLIVLMWKDSSVRLGFQQQPSFWSSVVKAQVEAELVKTCLKHFQIRFTKIVSKKPSMNKI